MELHTVLAVAFSDRFDVPCTPRKSPATATILEAVKGRRM